MSAQWDDDDDDDAKHLTEPYSVLRGTSAIVGTTIHTNAHRFQ